MASQARGLLTNQTASPDVVFNQAIAAALSRNHPRRQPETLATVDQWNLAKSLAFYKARFADASHFTFVFVGSFTADSIKPLVETYIASLPATGAHETWRDLGIAPSVGVVEKTIEKGIAPKSRVAIVFSGPFEYDDAHRLALRTMTLVLDSRLLDTIRQELGGTYSITAVPDTQKFPNPQYHVRIEWTCDPARTAALVQRVFEEVAFVKTRPLSPGQVALIHDSLLREFERNSQDNGYLLDQISRRYEDGDAADVAGFDHLPEQIAALTGDAIQLAARTYLDTGNYVRVTLMPETK
jgi:zinc protease